MKILNLLICFVLMIGPVLAQSTNPNNTLKMGDGAATVAKDIILNTGDGASNKRIRLTTGKEFDLNSNLNVTGTVKSTGDHTIGDGTNADKKITVDRLSFDPYIKWDEATKKWKFSNDGSVDKNFGSGSGGDSGVNILANPSVEDGIAVDFSNSGGTLTNQTYGNPDPNGNDSAYAQFVSTTSGQYFETTVHATPSFLTGGCLAKVNYQTTDTASWKLQVYDNASNLLIEQALGISTWSNGYASFPCPAVGTSIKMRIISLAAGTILSDKFYLGAENRTYQVKKDKLVGVIEFPSGCSGWSVSNSGSYTSMNTNATCASPVVTGTIKVAPTTAPSFTLASGSSKGTYRVTWNAKISASSGVPNTTACAFRLFDGTNGYTLGEVQHVSNNSTNITTGVPSMEGIITLAADLSADTTYIVQAYSTDGANANRSCNIAKSGTYGPVVSVDYLGDASQTALSPSAQDWFIDASIGGTNPSIGTTTVSSYSEIANGSLDLVQNTGSAAVKIPCSGTNSATGTTCSVGNESIGVNFTAPQAGYYEVCVQGSHYAVLATAATQAVSATFQLIETANGSQTILQEGKGKASHVVENLASNINRAEGASIGHCGSFYFSSAGERTIRLMYEQAITGTPTSNFLLADRDSTTGQRDFRIIVRPLLSPYNRPYLLPSDKLTTIGGSYTALTSDGTIYYAGSSAITVTLPSALTNSSKYYQFKNAGSNTMSLAFSGGETLDGSLTAFTLYPNEEFEVQSNGSGWVTMSSGARIPGWGRPKIHMATMNATCGVTSQGGQNWLSSCSGTSTCSCTISAGIFAATPICIGSKNTNGGSTIYNCGAGASSATALTSMCSAGSSPTGTDRVVVCFGY